MAVPVEGTSIEVIGLRVKTKVLLEGTWRGQGEVDKKKGGGESVHRFWGFVLAERWLEDCSPEDMGRS